MVATQPSYDLRTNQFTMVSDGTLPMGSGSLRNEEMFQKWKKELELWEIKIHSPNGKNGAMITSMPHNTSRIKENPELLLKDEVLIGDAIDKAPIAAKFGSPLRPLRWDGIFGN